MPERSPLPFNPVQMQGRCAELAARGIFIGTSSWKYRGWCGQLYDESKYAYRGKFAETRFERMCLEEYANVFRTVCVDAAYYKFPSPQYLEGLVSQVPSEFLFTFKVTDDITIKKFTNLPRFGIRAGKPNENYLNAGLFERAFLGPLEPFRKNVGLLMFEFSHFYPSDYGHGREILYTQDANSHLDANPIGCQTFWRDFIPSLHFVALSAVCLRWAGRRRQFTSHTIPDSPLP